MAKRIIFILSIFAASLLAAKNVSALGVGSSYTLPLTVEGSFATVPSANPAIPYLDHGRLLYQVQGGAQITRLGFGLGNSPSGTPGLSNHPHIISFTIDYDFPSTMDSFYHSPSWTNMVLLHDSCYGAIETTFTNSFSCTYTLLTVSATTQVITQDGQFIVSTRVLNGTSPATWLTVTPVRVISLYNGVTEEQVDDLQTAITQAIEDLEISIEGSTPPTPEQIQAATEQAIQNTLEDEKSQYEEQSEEVQDQLESDSSAAQGTATSLLSVVGQFIGVLTSAQPTNCNIDGSLIPHLPLGNLNLCTHSPPPVITIIGSLLLIAFVVPLAYYTVKRMLALIGSFQS